MDSETSYRRQLMDICLMKLWKSESVMKLYASIKSVNCGFSMRQASGDSPRKGDCECKDQCYFPSSYCASEAEKNIGYKRNLVEWRLTRLPRVRIYWLWGKNN